MVPTVLASSRPALPLPAPRVSEPELAPVARASQPLPGGPLPPSVAPTIRYSGDLSNVASYAGYQVDPAIAVRSRKPLYIGLAVLVIGVAVMLVVVLLGDNADDLLTHSDPAATPRSAQAGTVGDDPTDDFIMVHVTSRPLGAEVLVAGTRIGKTPLDTKLKRGSKIADLKVHLDGYVEASSKIDLGGDYQKDVVLSPVDQASGEVSKEGKAATEVGEAVQARGSKETKAAKDGKDSKETPAPKEPHPHVVRVHSTAAAAPPPPHETKSPHCQPPNAYNPFDTTCGGQPCPVCK
jgi:hypothetical protein